MFVCHMLSISYVNKSLVLHENATFLNLNLLIFHKIIFHHINKALDINLLTC